MVGEDIANMLKNLNNLAALSLSFNKGGVSQRNRYMNDESAEKIAEAIGGLGSLGSVSIDFTENDRIEDKGALALGAALAKNSKLEKVNLRFCAESVKKDTLEKLLKDLASVKDLKV